MSEPEAPSSAAAIQIDSAEHVLKPFVDAVLAKYGLTRDDDGAPAKDSSREDPVPGG